MNNVVTALVVLGSLTCKVCVVDLEHYFRGTKGVKLEICVNSTGNFIADQSLIRYHSSAVKMTGIDVCAASIDFPYYPVLLLSTSTDTILMTYDSLFLGGELNKKLVDRNLRRLKQRK